MQQLGGLCDVVNVCGGADDGVDQTRVSIHGAVRFHAKVPLVPFLDAATFDPCPTVKDPRCIALAIPWANGTRFVLMTPACLAPSISSSIFWRNWAGQDPLDLNRLALFFCAPFFTGGCRSNSVRPLSVDISNVPEGSRTVAGAL